MKAIVARLPKTGLCLFQPWATQVVRGEIPLLVRSQGSTSNIVIGIVATTFLNRVEREEKDLPEKSIVGTARIHEVVKLKVGEVVNYIDKVYGHEVVDKYPFKILIPDKNYYYVYRLIDPFEFKNPIPLSRKFLRGWVPLGLKGKKT